MVITRHAGAGHWRRHLPGTGGCSQPHVLRLRRRDNRPLGCCFCCFTAVVTGEFALGSTAASARSVVQSLSVLLSSSSRSINIYKQTCQCQHASSFPVSVGLLLLQYVLLFVCGGVQYVLCSASEVSMLLVVLFGLLEIKFS